MAKKAKSQNPIHRPLAHRLDGAPGTRTTSTRRSQAFIEFDENGTGDVPLRLRPGAHGLPTDHTRRRASRGVDLGGGNDEMDAADRAGAGRC